MKKTAIMVDGGFYRSVAYRVFGERTPEMRAKELEDYCKKHIRDNHEERELYRIFYYDCLPSKKKVFHPLTQQQIDLSKSELYGWMTEFTESLKSRRKFALRLGTLSEEQVVYNLRYETTKKLCNGKYQLNQLTADDFELHIEQKGVDMKIGIDIASLAYKHLADQIILISGDSDFVPAAKLARREGIDFILDPMRQHIKSDLFEHIDGIQSKVPHNRPNVKPPEEVT